MPILQLDGLPRGSFLAKIFNHLITTVTATAMFLALAFKPISSYQTMNSIPNGAMKVGSRGR
jgi:hypothetical protein